MSDTDLIVSHPVWVKVGVTGLDSNGLVGAMVWDRLPAGRKVIRRAALPTRSAESLWYRSWAVERWARQQQPDRRVNRGQQMRRLRLPRGEVAIRRTRVRDQLTGRTYNLADRLLGLRPYVLRVLYGDAHRW
jgi:hypothetical protein